MRLLPCGPRAVMAEFESLADAMAAAGAVRAAAIAGVVDIVPAARTVLVTHRPGVDEAAVVGALGKGPSVVLAGGPLVEVPVVYDGVDLGDVAAATGFSVDEVIRRHCATEYTVAFCGFMPGFSYLVGLDPALQLPRRATPRPRVPAGAVAIASEYSAVYPGASPGGWHLLGTTDMPMWLPSREVPATLPPGTRVRFVPR